MLFGDAMVDEVPGKCFLGVLPPVNVKIGVNVYFLEDLEPVAPMFMDRKENFSNLPVTEGQERLDIIPFRDVVNDSYGFFPLQVTLNPSDSSPDGVGVF